MAEQRVSNERKRELEQIDLFQEYLIKSINFISRHKKQFVIAITAVLSVIIIVSGIMYSFNKSEEAASLLAAKAVTEYEKISDPAEGYEAVSSDFQTLFKDYANTAAGKQANVTFAKICFDAEKFDLSLKHYKKALALYDDKAMMGNFLLSSLGHVSIAMKDYDAAEKYFKQVEASEEDLLKDEAQFSLAMIYELSDRRAESKKRYEKIVADHADSLYLAIAKSKINQLGGGSE